MSEGQGTLFEVPDDWWVRRRCQVCGCALSRLHSHLYVVQRQWWVKIGSTDNLKRRINELARPAWRKHLLFPEGMDWDEPLVRHAIIIGGGYMEHELHQRFQKLHVVGEWFEKDHDLRDWIKEVTSERKAQAGQG